MKTKHASTRTEKVQAARDMLETHVKELAEQMRQGKSESLARYLDFSAQFHQYSFRNLMLIMLQCPDASQVAGLRQWNKLGRQVRAGEHGIMILAPMAVWRRSEGDAEPASEAETTQSERTETRSKITIFKPVYVFNVSQTEGEPLPEFQRACGDVSECLPALREVIRERGITLEEREVVARSSTTNGASYGGRIVLQQGLPDAEAFSVLVHELSHEQLHWGKEVRAMKLGKTIEEVEADATAYVVCRHFGVECHASDYLLLHHAKPDTLLERLETVRETAAGIINGIEARLREEVTADSA